MVTLLFTILLLHVFSLWNIASHRVTLCQYFKTDVDITVTCLLFKNSGFFGTVGSLLDIFCKTVLAPNEY